VFANQVSLTVTSCSLSFDPASACDQPDAATYAISVTAGTGCPWRVESGADWITVH
jgi:hypothetical protein